MVLRSEPSWLEGCHGDKEELAKKTATDEAFRAQYRAAVEKWEEPRSQGKYSAMPKKVEAYQDDELETEVFLGYLWPYSVYKAVHKKEPKDNGHIIQTIQGRKCCILDESWGTHETVKGVERFVRKRRTGVSLSGELANTAEGSTQEQIDATHKAAQVQLNLKATSKDNGEIQVKGAKMHGGADDEEGDDALMLEIWGNAITRAKARKTKDGEDTDTAQETDSASASASTRPQKSIPVKREPESSSSSAAALPSPATKKKKMDDTLVQKLNIDFDALKAEIIIVGAQCTVSRLFLTSVMKLKKRAELLIEKYDAKMTGNKTEIGVQVLTIATTNQQSLSCFVALVEKIQSSFDLTTVFDDLDALNSMGVEMKSHWYDLVYAIACVHKLEAQEFQDVLEMCKSGSEAPCAVHRVFSTAGEHESKVIRWETIRARIFLEWSHTLLAKPVPVADQQAIGKALSEVRTFVKAFVDDVVVSEPNKFTIQYISAMLLFDPAEVSSDSVSTWQTAIERLTKDRKDSLAKALLASENKKEQTQALGAVLRAQITTCADCYTADRGYAMDLDSVKSACDMLVPPSRALIVQSLTTNSVLVTRWAKSYETLKSCLKNGTETFKLRYYETINECQKKFEELSEVTFSGLMLRMEEELDLRLLSVLFDEFTTDLTKAAACKQLEDKLSKIKTFAFAPANLDVEKLLTAGVQQKIKDVNQWLNEFFVELNRSLPSLHELCVATGKDIKTVVDNLKNLYGLIWGEASNKVEISWFPDLGRVVLRISDLTMAAHMQRCELVLNMGHKYCYGKTELVSIDGPFPSDEKSLLEEGVLKDLCMSYFVMGVMELPLPKTKVRIDEVVMWGFFLEWALAAGKVEGEPVKLDKMHSLILEVSRYLCLVGAQERWATTVSKHYASLAAEVKEDLARATQAFRDMMKVTLDHASKLKLNDLDPSKPMEKTAVLEKLNAQVTADLHASVAPLRACRDAAFTKGRWARDTLLPSVIAFSATMGQDLKESLNLLVAQNESVDQNDGPKVSRTLGALTCLQVLFVKDDSEKGPLAARLAASFKQAADKEPSCLRVTAEATYIAMLQAAAANQGSST